MRTKGGYISYFIPGRWIGLVKRGKGEVEEEVRTGQEESIEGGDTDGKERTRPGGHPPENKTIQGVNLQV